MPSEWIVRIGDRDYPVDGLQQLQAWTAEGRVQPSDYVYHPTLERWLYAKEVEELRGVFPPPPAARPVAPPIPAWAKGPVVVAFHEEGTRA